MILVDTSFLIRALVKGSTEDRLLRSWLPSEALGMSAIAWTEFLCGPLEARQHALASRIVPDLLPFLAEDAATAARLFNEAGRRRGSVVDCMIAAVALRVEAPLATANPADFQRFAASGLRLRAP